MRVGCLCVTEARKWRPQLFGIAAASFADQTHGDKELLVITDNVGPYQETLDRLGIAGSVIHSPLRDYQTVCQRLDLGYEALADRGCDLLAVWDDDDWKHPNFLSACVDQFAREPYEEHFLGGVRHVDPTAWVVTGYVWGHYVDARHLWAEDLLGRTSPWGYWGASLVFRRAAWEQRPWTLFSFPGQDPAWCQSWSRDQWAPPVDLDSKKMLSFCHGDNCYQHCRGGGFDLKPWLAINVSDLARGEMYRVRDAMAAVNFEVPQTNRPYG